MNSPNHIVFIFFKSAFAFHLQMKGMGGDEYAFQGIYFGVIRANANITNSSRIKSRTATKIQNDRKIRVPTVFLVFVLWWFFFFFFCTQLWKVAKKCSTVQTQDRGNHSPECFCFSNQMWKLVKLSFLEVTGKIYIFVYFFIISLYT